MHAVSVTWEGTRVTGPILIYHDEIKVDPGPAYEIGDDINTDGALVCTSETGPRVSWRKSNLMFVNDVYPLGANITQLNQIRTPFSSVPNVARLSRDNEAVTPSAADQNGLWTCWVKNTSAANIGIYQRGMGEYITPEPSYMVAL
jgi:hypothetical protein